MNWIYKEKVVSRSSEELKNFSNEQLADIEAMELRGFRVLKEEPYPDRRYYSYVESVDYTNSTRTRVPVDLDINLIKSRMVSSVNTVAKDKFNQATVDYTAGEMASWPELESEAKEVVGGGILTDGMLFDEAYFSGIDIGDLALKVTSNADTFRQLKSYISGTRKKLTDIINNLSTIDECILFESTPYEYTITEEDVLENGLVVGDVVTKYKNNCTDW